VRHALLLAALNADDDLAVIAAACAEAGTHVDALATAEASGLVAIGSGTVSFRHPLIRAAARSVSTAEERRAAHRALAAVVEGDVRVWHLAAATGPDEDLASELERLGAAAAARRGFATAAAALERAASLSPDRDSMARRTLAAGESAAAAGAPEQALSLLQTSAQKAGEPGLRARAEHGRAVVMLWSGAVEPAGALLQAEAERVLGHDPVRGAVLLADAASALTGAGRFPEALRCAERAGAVLGEDGPDHTRAHVLTILAYALILRGHMRRALPLLDEADRLGAAVDALAPGAQWTHLLLRMRIATGQFERARETNLALAARARDAGALTALGGSLVVAADAAFALGEWDAVEAETREALAVADDTSQQVMRGLALTTRARLLAARGSPDESRRAAELALDVARTVQISAGLRYGHGALGFLELGLDRIDRAIEELEEVERLSAATGNEESTLVPWAGDLIEAYVRAGAASAARRVIATLERQAASSGSTTAKAVLARSEGLLADDYPTRFTQALALYDRRPMPFERARTLLAYGRRLHRARRRADARASLREALAGFERLGAQTWATQTREELKAAGARRRTARSDELTPQERRVARAVARGASNHEVAAELFLSPRTVEFHLRHVYRKLDIHNRTELAARLAKNPGR
jgi:DNA-binding CsgD family transcriptional regulator